MDVWADFIIDDDEKEIFMCVIFSEEEKNMLGISDWEWEWGKKIMRFASVKQVYSTTFSSSCYFFCYSSISFSFLALCLPWFFFRFAPLLCLWMALFFFENEKISLNYKNNKSSSFIVYHRDSYCSWLISSICVMCRVEIGSEILRVSQQQKKIYITSVYWWSTAGAAQC